MYLIAVLRRIQCCNVLVVVIVPTARSKANVEVGSVAGESIAQLNTDDSKTQQTNDRLREERH